MKDRIIEIDVYTINLDKVLYVDRISSGFSFPTYRIYFGSGDNYVPIDNNKFAREEFIKLWKSYFNQ